MKQDAQILSLRVYLIQPQLVRTVIRISLSLQITGEENKQT